MIHHRAIFLDRDGVLNRPLIQNQKGYAPRTLADFSIYREAPAAIAMLKEAGFIIVVVTNQPDIGHGLVAASDVALMHQQLQAAMPIDGIFVCPHRQDEGCRCRKPRPGMIEEAMRRFAIDTTKSFLIGDRSSDIAAGQVMGCTTVFIDRHYREPLTAVPDWQASSVWEAAEWIMRRLGDVPKSL
ncbi:MAG: HAD-IIIA family hydrolase [Nitrospirae bacterium]|nr:HAD-IIIA family hydrolase [Magnetococcales bacterium]HAT50670.1 HAD family hydrolase [Alphaproteobacteria bacterium]